MTAESADNVSNSTGKEVAGKKVPARYQRLWIYAVLFTAMVSLVPVVILTLVNAYQYDRMIEAETFSFVGRLVSDARRSFEEFLQRHQDTLAKVAGEYSYAQLRDPEELDRVLIQASESLDGLTGLAVIDADGTRQSHAGRGEEETREPGRRQWFTDAELRGAGISEVTRGEDGTGRFTVAVRRDRWEDGRFFVLAATIDAEMLAEHLASLDLELGPSADVFLANRDGLPQTRPRLGGDILQRHPTGAPLDFSAAKDVEITDQSGDADILGYARIDDSPLVFVVLTSPKDVMEDRIYPRNHSFWILGVSAVFLLASTLWFATNLLRRIHGADEQLAEVLHNVEYTNRMASIGRLAAGVAHEINNPLSIIEENAGLLTDLLTLTDAPPDRERFLAIADSVRNSVTRCAAITHGLLGFAKTMEPTTTPIDLRALIEEVLNFERRLAGYRNLNITTDIPKTLPAIESDRGQLQQVFLNILTNAFDAVDDGGRVDISMELRDENTITVMITDNGHGIPEKNLKRIFEPFFTTKLEYGTGLGLSITYGLVVKLGGHINVQSEIGKGSTFTVRLPVKRPTQD
ncbi:MAG: ATP-binding protein [Planctomycetes bacterium]|nr:ATP-binding protein [Planctomycetota bacterium]